MEKEIKKQIEKIPEEFEFFVWVYEMGNSTELWASTVWKSRSEAMKYIPQYNKKILVSFKIEKKDFD